MTIQDFKTKYPDLYQVIFDEGHKAGHDEGFAQGEVKGVERGVAEAQEQAREEGARAERERIKSVEAQSIPGHEKLIQDLKFDGKTTGEQAAVQILQTEKTLRHNTAAQLKEDAPDPVEYVEAPGAGDNISNMPEGKDKWKAEFENSADLQKEFKSCETYIAFKQGVAKGRVRILGKKEVK